MGYAAHCTMQSLDIIEKRYCKSGIQLCITPHPSEIPLQICVLLASLLFRQDMLSAFWYLMEGKWLHRMLYSIVFLENYQLLLGFYVS